MSNFPEDLRPLLDQLMELTPAEVNLVLWEVQQRSGVSLTPYDPAEGRGSPAYGGPPFTLRKLEEARDIPETYDVVLTHVGPRRQDVIRVIREPFVRNPLPFLEACNILKLVEDGKPTVVLVVEATCVGTANHFCQCLRDVGATAHVQPSRR